MSEETRNNGGENPVEVTTETAAIKEEPVVAAEPVAEEPVVNAEPVTEEPVVNAEPVAEEPVVVTAEPATQSQPLGNEPTQGTQNSAYDEVSYHDQPPQNDGTSGKTVAALILGITSISLSFTLMLSFFGLAAGIVGLIFAIKERKTHPSGMAMASFVLSLIGVIAGAVSSVACVACMGFYGWLGYAGFFDDPGTMDMFNGMDL